MGRQVMVLGEIEGAFRDAISEVVPDAAGTDPAIRRSEFADYQADAALALARVAGGSPREVAQALVAEAKLEGLAYLEVAGPGFVNIRLRDEFLSDRLSGLGSAAALLPPGSSEKLVIDYSAPNVAKEMHVGHLRSTVIGDALARILERSGREVVRQNHLGDWGTPFGMLIEHLMDREGDPGAWTVRDLNAAYQAAQDRFRRDETFAQRARERVVALQNGDPDTTVWWEELVRVSTSYFSEIYERLDVSLGPEHLAPESRYDPMLDDIVEELQAKGLLEESEGALCVFVEGFEGRDGNPLPLIVKKTDGGYGYAATDLAAIRYRARELAADRLVYVVGAPQSLHLSMVFAVAREAGWLGDEVRIDHAAFGSVLGEDGKMLRTRSGDPIRLSDLLDEAEARAADLVAERTDRTDIDPTLVHDLAVGAIKYADLSSDRLKDYTFSFDRMLSFQGNTAPYLQYAHARIRSLLRKADEDVGAAPIEVTHEAEHDLALRLLEWPYTFADVVESLRPHRLCTYLYDLASDFTQFYEACPVLAAPSTQRRSRLRLAQLTGDVLAEGLHVLGLAAPERM